jgi:hypothetical protein
MELLMHQQWVSVAEQLSKTPQQILLHTDLHQALMDRKRVKVLQVWLVHYQMVNMDEELQQMVEVAEMRIMQEAVAVLMQAQEPGMDLEIHKTQTQTGLQLGT